ncbi:MAG: zinc-binding alcohol dehydrogenase family protein [Anaerolineales bacterium]
MKAAVLHHFGQAPRFEDFPDPIPAAGQLLVYVKAVVLENVDKATAMGAHYASQQLFPSLPAVVGHGGIGALEDGRLVGFGGVKPPYGAIAEKVVIPQGYFVPIPDGVDAITAAAYPASALTALLPLKWGAQLRPGETVLVNGATGVSGKLAVQIAKLLGAGRVVGTGRNEQSMARLKEFGADAVIDLKLPDQQLAEAFTRAAGQGYNVILDFVWGHPTEVLIKTLVPKELGFARGQVRLVQVGEMAGPSIVLPASALRTSGLEITGAGAGLSPEAIAEGTALAWKFILEKKISMDIEQVALKDIQEIWQRTDFQGRRMVVVP